MPSSKFENKVTVEDILKDNPDHKVLLAKIYMQTLKTNGQVRENCKELDTLKKEIKEKISWKVFATISAVLTAVIILFNVLDVIGG